MSMLADYIDPDISLLIPVKEEKVTFYRDQF